MSATAANIFFVHLLSCRTVSELYPPTKKYCATDRAVTDSDRQWFHDRLQDLGFRSLGWILSPEPAAESTVLHVPTVDDLSQHAQNVQELCKRLQLTPEEIQQIERITRGQRDNPLWTAYRKGRITASNFQPVLKVCSANRKPSKSLISALLGDKDLSRVRAAQWGITHEETAINEYMAARDITVQPAGIWLHKSGLIGASPDGIVDEQRIIEVKCPYSARDKSLLDLVDGSHSEGKKKGFFLCRVNDSSTEFALNRNDDVGHKYYDQIQGNMYLTGRSVCDLIVWTPLETAVISIVREEAWQKNIELLCEFSRKQFLPLVLASYK